ncbi:MAG: DUF3566 domain-containing protein [Propionibacteriaceae bacterium]|jgi:hypothetical protein|nr:DUF3566 domain-containing protein [Propionibacteriaceae bacterium]
MTESTQANAAGAADASPQLSGNVGSRIAQSFRNRAARVKAAVTEPAAQSVPVAAAPPQTQTTFAPPPVAHDSADLPPSVASPVDPAGASASGFATMATYTPTLRDQPMAAQVAAHPETASGPRSAVMVSAAKTARKPRSRPSSRRARLRISRLDPWSVMKVTLLFAVAAWIIFIVATFVSFSVLDGTGLYDSINGAIAQVFTSPGSTNTFNIKDYVNTTRATALAAVVGAVNVVIITALATIFAFLYNLAATVMGGIEVTMAED